MSEEVENLLLLTAIEEISPHPLTSGVYSGVLLVPQKTDGNKSVTELFNLNTYLVVPPFHNWDKHVNQSFYPDWNVDYKKVFQFRAMSFRLSLVFTKVVQTEISHLHSLANQIYSYLDDFRFEERQYFEGSKFHGRFPPNLYNSWTIFRLSTSS